MIRGLAAPNPCNARPASMTSKLCARIETAQTMANKLKPRQTIGLRPKGSESKEMTNAQPNEEPTN